MSIGPYVHPRHASGQTHPCKCGCGEQIAKFDKNGKKRVYKRGHHRRKGNTAKLIGVVIYFEPEMLAELRDISTTYGISISTLVRDELGVSMQDGRIETQE